MVREMILEPLLQTPWSKPVHAKTFIFGDGQDRFLDQTYFHEVKKGGFFIEAGAYNGLSDSNSIHFEEQHGWTGLLVEPVPSMFAELRRTSRRAKAVQTCLSTGVQPQTVNFSLYTPIYGKMNGVMEEGEESSTMVRMQCVPLYTILLALH